MWWSILQGLFLDVPRVIDHAWRHLEYRANAECDYDPRWVNPQTNAVTAPAIALRPFYKRPPFWFFALTVFFASYGPTWEGLCAIAPNGVTAFLRQAIAVLLAITTLVLLILAIPPLCFLIKGRFDEVRNQPPGNDLPLARRITCILVISAGLLALAAAAFSGAWFLYRTPPGGLVCALDEWNLLAIEQLAMCLIAVGLFAGLTSCRWLYDRFVAPRGWSRIEFDVLLQFVLLAAVAAIQWFGLADATTTAASDLPYRHVFLLFAPAVAAVLALAPWWARSRYRTVTGELRIHFRDLLPQTELFVHPTDPPLSWRSIVYGFLFAPVKRILHLLLFPALVAVSVPAESLYWPVVVAFVVSLLLVVWGNMSPRWQELNTYIERWFLRGTPLLISLFVILVAALRLYGVDYITTLLDAIPFGTIFGLVLMSYVLFWLAEYWMSRSAALELLGILGDVQDETYVPYRPTFGQAEHPNVQVDVNDRKLAAHATGRFVALGRVLTPVRCRAFQAYYLTETFETLDPDPDSEEVMEIGQRTGNYFAGLNVALAVVAALFVGYAAAKHRETAIKPVAIENQVAPSPDRLVDLAGLLQQGAQPARPAIVVVASGGGTRAALYATSVLRGLHRLQVDRDIVLVSGVSGGGVALAYFAANSPVLTGASAPAASTLCAQGTSVDAQWACFRDNVTKPFIEDVVNGATEWRIFTNTELSQLLAESFEHYLFDNRTLGSVRSPALILNTTIVGHPAAESAVLARTINAPTTCEEAEQVFQMTSGGRLVFTNLRDTAAFGRDAPDAELPDIRLPYRVVRDPDISLASAAALNANFPPVFPAARVRIHDGESSCPWRTFYVTDGGAEENLGLISALYALESALAKLKERGARARPIHMVIAEASALDYDYTQDRGLGVLLGGSRERLAGGLTGELRNRVDTMLAGVNGGDARIHYHLLTLPLAFRSRGGFGTHWLYAESFRLSDPRPRTTARHNASIFEGAGEEVTIGRQGLEELWLALHDPDTPFCAAKTFAEPQSVKVQGWICGPAQAGGTDRDLHMQAWEQLVRELRGP